MNDYQQNAIYNLEARLNVAETRANNAESEAQSLRLEIISLLGQFQETSYYRAVYEAAKRLKDSGYDGPFMGEAIEELFNAINEAENVTS